MCSYTYKALLSIILKALTILFVYCMPYISILKSFHYVFTIRSSMVFYGLNYELGRKKLEV